MAILQFASPPFTFKTNTPSKAEMVELIDRSLDNGALGVKLLGGHYPLTPEVSATLIETALERRAYIAWLRAPVRTAPILKACKRRLKWLTATPFT